MDILLKILYKLLKQESPNPKRELKFSMWFDRKLEDHTRSPLIHGQI